MKLTWYLERIVINAYLGKEENLKIFQLSNQHKKLETGQQSYLGLCETIAKQRNGTAERA